MRYSSWSPSLPSSTTCVHATREAQSDRDSSGLFRCGTKSGSSAGIKNGRRQRPVRLCYVLVRQVMLGHASRSNCWGNCLISKSGFNVVLTLMRAGGAAALIACKLKRRPDPTVNTYIPTDACLIFIMILILCFVCDHPKSAISNDDSDCIRAG